MPSHCNLNVRLKVWWYLSNVTWILGCLSLFHSYLMCFPNDCNVMWSCNFGHPTRHLIIYTVVCKGAPWFFVPDYFNSCCNAFSYSFPIYWNIFEIMIWQAMTRQQHGKQLYWQIFCNAWNEKKTFPTLFNKIDLDLHRMCTSYVHP
jgi:hypothetical protein